MLFASKMALAKHTTSILSKNRRFQVANGTMRSKSAFTANYHNCQRRKQSLATDRSSSHLPKQTIANSMTQLTSTQTSPHLEKDKPPTSSYNPIVQSRIDALISHPAVVWDESSTFSSMHKKKLNRRHLHLFDRSNNSVSEKDNNISKSGTSIYQDDLFDKFATAVCHAGVVARKEVFETWASALYIHYTFLRNDNSSENSSGIEPIKRIVDVAAGHGLLAWALLLLSDHDERNNDNELTVFCLDVQMPPSAEIIHTNMIQQWPHLNERFDYVEARLEQLVPHKSCLLASVHACGILSDILVATAAEHQMPLAVVPCCHSRKRKLLENCASPFAKREYDDILNAKRSLPNLADLLDGARIAALENAGCDVMEFFIPEIFTGKNRLIMSRPNDAMEAKSDDTAASIATRRRSTPFRKGQMPPLLDKDSPTTTAINPKARFMKGFYVPCEDTKESRDIVSKIAGRAAANKRKELMHNRNHVIAPQMDLSLWLPPDDSDVDDRVMLTAESLALILKKASPENVTCDVSNLGDIYINPAGRKAQTFRVQYNQVDGETISFEDAKSMHAQLREAVPLQFPGAECR